MILIYNYRHVPRAKNERILIMTEDENPFSDNSSYAFKKEIGKNSQY
jgi:hypothetical protein